MCWTPARSPNALRDVHTAYYLVHSMASSRDYAENDRKGAEHFARAAREAGVQRIIYLGGLGHGEMLSRHLASRQEVGRIFRESGVPTIELRASIVIGSGSLSFELVRALVEKLPAMVTPRWVDTPTQPIGIEDVVAYLVAALDRPAGESTIYEIGGPDRVSYGDLMREYARLRGLKRVMVPVPVLSPRLSGLWLGLVTPVYSQVGRELIDGMRNPTVVEDDRALSRLRRAAARRARGAQSRTRQRGSRLRRDPLVGRAVVATEASKLGRCPVRLETGGLEGGMGAPDPGAGVPAHRPDRRTSGLVLGQSIVALRGLLDLAVGGPGLRRGRSDPECCGSEKPSTSGVSRPSSPVTCSASPRRCGCPAAPGSSSRSPPKTAAA